MTGVILQPNVEDAHGDLFEEDVIREAAHGYLQFYKHTDLEHVANADALVEVVESYIAPVDFELNGEKVTKGSWIATFQVHSKEVWEAIKDGTFTGLSPVGIAEIDVEEDDSLPQE